MPFARHTLDAFQFCQVSVGFYANLTKDFFVINIWLKLFVVTMVREIVKTGTWKYPSDILLISDHRNTQQTETKYDLENVEKPLAPLITMLEPPLLEALFPHWSPPCPCPPKKPPCPPTNHVSTSFAGGIGPSSEVQLCCQRSLGYWWKRRAPCSTPCQVCLYSPVI